jgi:hypothetical protein
MNNDYDAEMVEAESNVVALVEATFETNKTLKAMMDNIVSSLQQYVLGEGESVDGWSSRIELNRACAAAVLDGIVSYAKMREDQ